jgi:hypothetical protein
MRLWTQAVLPQLFCALGAHEEGDVLTCIQQARTEVATQRLRRPPEIS